ncbi:MAG: endonuclease/exonuclease/phosphatase family protein [Clostridiales bacterium]|nr:endonuclease/exonuclease/phosphatase family protein [Clostridiales bacterium]
MREKKKRTKKRLALRIVLSTIGVLLLIVVSYVIYAFASYYRLPDNIELTPKPDPGRYMTMGRKPPERIIVSTEEETYTIMTYNIGFGAYTPDYSFFMDGGKYSWARSKDGLIQNLKDIANMITDSDPDFVLLQEVDEDGTRSRHVCEVNYMCAMDYYQHVYAQNFDSPFLFWPLLEPHGANKSGILTLSKAYIRSALRRSLPVSDSLSKIVDYDRCYSISRIPLGKTTSAPYPFNGTTDPEGKELVLFNVHLSAYSTESVREAQLSMLFEDMQNEYAKGNYVICGGDFNHNLRKDSTSENVPGWAQSFPRESIPGAFSFGFETSATGSGKPAPVVNIAHDSCRNADEAYDPQTTFTVLADGFIVSDNIEVVYYESIDMQYAYSDHDPVIMEFSLKD